MLFIIQVLEGYGQTECTAGATLSTLGDTGTGNVGAVLPCGKVKLIDAPEMKYFAENGEGEVCFKGPCITRGYYKEPEKTAALFDPDGWVKSGDVGKWMPNGTLKIIDRVKHIFKLAQVGLWVIIYIIIMILCVDRESILRQKRLRTYAFVHVILLKCFYLVTVSKVHVLL